MENYLSVWAIKKHQTNLSYYGFKDPSRYLWFSINFTLVPDSYLHHIKTESLTREVPKNKNKPKNIKIKNESLSLVLQYGFVTQVSPRDSLLNVAHLLLPCPFRKKCINHYHITYEGDVMNNNKCVIWHLNNRLCQPVGRSSMKPDIWGPPFCLLWPPEKWESLKLSTCHKNTKVHPCQANYLDNNNSE